MTCGERGGRTKHGEPCRQPIGSNREACVWHDPTTTVEAKLAVAHKGGLISASRRFLPPDAPIPTFDTRDAIVKYAEERAALVEQGRLDPRVSAEARGWADLAMRAHELAALDRLDKLERVVIKGKRVA